ncbi:LamB/YcsF family protein [Carboxylicivirga caseinilyticus]|uniref:LamB/YcsF family protein n=1 Tax=Carboxylicivirga caseinilyticus TaxID=3417572 RepID=UPI003D33562D|nr:LamB/YcsF family protein [Marinilabiliaceae bacterium A049]
MHTIDINCDLGESYGAYKIGNDLAILKFISSANIACGFHAGDPGVIRKTIEAALNHNVAIGAHPGFPDIQGFGRRNMYLSDDELFDTILYQVSALKGITEALGGKLQHVKPHGAMYNMAAKDYHMAKTIARAVKKIDPSLFFYGLANSQMIQAAKDEGLTTVSETFADRRYTKEGLLVPRSQPDAVIHDSNQCIQQVLTMAKDQKVISADGHEITLKADTICLHGDNVQALELAKHITEALEKSDIHISAINNWSIGI